MWDDKQVEIDAQAQVGGRFEGGTGSPKDTEAGEAHGRMALMAEVAESWQLERRKGRREADCTDAKGRDGSFF